jgi:predicted secreted protein
VSVTTALAIYFVMWWVVLFAILPWGVRSQHEGAAEDMVPGSDPGAPALPYLARKLLATTAVTAILFGIFYWVYVNQLITLDQLARLLGMPE